MSKTFRGLVNGQTRSIKNGEKGRALDGGRLDEYHHALDDFTLEIYPTLKSCFKRDEIIGRINQTVVFLPFEEEQITELVQHQLELWRNIAMEEHTIELAWSTDGT